MSLPEQWKLRGPVRELRSEFAEWDISREEWQAARRSSVVQFRPDEKVSDREEHHTNGSISRSRHIYDEAGRLLEMESRLDDGPVGRTVHRYDESGRLARTVVVDGHGAERESAVYSYDDRGLKTKLQSIPDLGKPASCGAMYEVEGAERGYGAEGVSTIATLYDDQEQPCEVLFRDEAGTLLLRVILIRDTAGLLVKEESQSGDVPPFPIAQAIEKMPAEERSAAAAVLEQMFGPQKPMWSATYRYDDRGRQIERCGSMGGLKHMQTTWEYDEHDNPIREIDENMSLGDLHPNESGKLQAVNKGTSRREVRYEYKYDSHANWTERVVSVRREMNPDFQRSNIERREIIYY